MDKQEKPPVSLRDRILYIRLYLVRVAVLIAVLAPLVIAAGMFGVRQGIFNGDMGQEVLTLTVAPGLAVVGGFLGVLAVLAALAIPPRRGLSLGLFAIAVAGVTYGGVASFKLRTAKAPPIHDVATDWNDPLMFGMTVMSARGQGANPAPQNPVVSEGGVDEALVGRRIADINAATCAAATPVVLTGAADQAFARAKAAATAERLEIVTENPLAGRLEATRTTPWFGYKDDVLFRLTPEGAGVKIDMRASRRQGMKDHGANCELIGKLRKRLGG